MISFTPITKVLLAPPHTLLHLQRHWFLPPSSLWCLLRFREHFATHLPPLPSLSSIPLAVIDSTIFLIPAFVNKSHIVLCFLLSWLQLVACRPFWKMISFAFSFSSRIWQRHFEQVKGWIMENCWSEVRWVCEGGLEGTHEGWCDRIAWRRVNWIYVSWRLKLVHIVHEMDSVVMSSTQ